MSAIAPVAHRHTPIGLAGKLVENVHVARDAPPILARHTANVGLFDEAGNNYRQRAAQGPHGVNRAIPGTPRPGH